MLSLVSLSHSTYQAWRTSGLSLSHLFSQSYDIEHDEVMALLSNLDSNPGLFNNLYDLALRSVSVIDSSVFNISAA